MNIEENRFNTFTEWPENAAVNPMRMAKGGFYYTGRNTEVQCFLCGTVISDWNFGDQVMARHRQANPDCPFVLNPNDTCNVPMLEAPDINRVRPQSSTVSLARSSAGPSSFTMVLGGKPRLERYATYEQRLSSFANWTSTAVTPESLARAGFYYLQQNDMVECAYCRGVMLMWEPGDDPVVYHRISFPNCDFLARQEEETAMATLEKDELVNVKLLPGTPSDLHKLGIQKHTAPSQLKYATFEGRLRTFQGWPQNLQQTPEMLATAGFYYVGTGDQVRCFHCDGGLHNWESDDDPWTEHARWFPKCGFVSIVRGQDFIRHCLDNRPALDPVILFGVSEGRDVSEVSSAPPSPINPESNSHSHFNSTPNLNSNQNSNSTVRHREITDAEVEELLHSTPAITALQIGLNLGRVKTALRQRMERFGVPYTNADQLIEHVRRIHLSEESNGFESSHEPPSDLANLLSQAVTEQSSSRSGSQGQSERSNGVKKSVASNGDNKKSPLHIDKVKKGENKSDIGPLSLEEENRRLREARLCKICMDREVSVVFLPCGHLATCGHCAPSLADCPMCRQEIRATVRTFLA